jgi:two-component system NtrC family response regulator
MPDMGGIELLRAARELQPKVEVIMMTAFANEATAHEAFLLALSILFTNPSTTNFLKKRSRAPLDKIARAAEAQTLKDENEALIKGQRAAAD